MAILNSKKTSLKTSLLEVNPKILISLLFIAEFSFASIDYQYQAYKCAIENYTKSQIFMLLSVAGKHKHLEKDSMKMFEDWREIAMNYVPKGLTRKEKQYIVEEDRGNLLKDLEKKYGDIVNNHSAILGSLLTK